MSGWAVYDYYKDGALVASGTCPEIADSLGLSVVTVMNYRYNPKKGVRMVRVRRKAPAATLGGKECEMDVLDTGNEAAYEHREYIMHCKSCHHEFGYVQYNEDGDTWQDEKPAFCPKCGRKVKDAER